MKTHVQQIVDTVEVKTRKIIKNTMQGKKPDLDNRTKVNHVIKQADTDAIVEGNHIGSRNPETDQAVLERSVNSRHRE